MAPSTFTIIEFQQRTGEEAYFTTDPEFVGRRRYEIAPVVLYLESERLAKQRFAIDSVDGGRTESVRDRSKDSVPVVFGATEPEARETTRPSRPAVTKCQTIPGA